MREVLQFIDHFSVPAVISEIDKLAKGRTIQIVSDFDETLCNQYFFSENWKTHVPIIKTELSSAAQLLINPLCIATARTAGEYVTWLMWHKLSRHPMPIVAENGGVLVWPAKKISEPYRTKILLNQRQKALISEINTRFKEDMMSQLEIPKGHELLLREGRFTSVEIRAQEEITKRGTPEDYELIQTQIIQLLDSCLDEVEIVTTGSSLSIQVKGINKNTGLHAAISESGIQLENIFFVGLGDNRNDIPVFNFVHQYNGITIGVGSTTMDDCDFVFHDGDVTSTQIITALSRIG